MRRFIYYAFIFSSLFFVLCIHISAYAQSDIICSRCSITITGTYWKMNEQILCPTCYKASLPRCSVCRKTIKGEYWKNSSGCYCKDCTPRCDQCRKILSGRFWKTNNKNLCEQCYNRLGPRCFICSEVLKEKYFQIQNSDKKVCEKCNELYSPCKNCSFPVGPRGITIENGFVLCTECAKTAIVLSSQVIPIFRDVQKTVKKLFGFEVFIPDENIIITDGKTISRKSSDSSEYIPRGGAAGLYTFIEGVATIYVQKGHSPVRTMEIIVHEYIHLWQEYNCPPDQETSLREGFAEWAAYKVLCYKKYYSLADLKTKNPDPMYGNNLRKIIEMEKRIGPCGVIDYVKTQKRFHTNSKNSVNM